MQPLVLLFVTARAEQKDALALAPTGGENPTACPHFPSLRARAQDPGQKMQFSSRRIEVQGLSRAN